MSASTALALRPAATPEIRLERARRKTARLEREEARRDRLYDALLSPTVIRLGLLAAIIAYSTHCARSEENVGPVQSALAFALPGIGIPMIAADAGIHDKFALAAISAAGVGYVTGQMVQGWSAENLWQALTPWND